MNDVSPSDDELVSSYLDSEATPEEVARVEGDSDLLARAEEMRSAIGLTATPVQIPELDLARIRAAAVAASDTTPVVRDLRAAGAARTRRQQLLPRLLAVAAAFLFLGVAVTVIRSIDADEGTDTASGGDAVSDSADAGEDGDSGDDAGGFDALGNSDSETAESDDQATESASAAAPLAGDDASADAGDGAAADEAGAELDLDDALPERAFPFGPDDTFDVLAAELDPSADTEALLEQIRADVSAFFKAAELRFAEPDDPIDPPCVDNFAGVLVELGADAADIALATVADQEVVVVVARNEAGDLFMLSSLVGNCGAIQIEPLIISG